MATRNPIPSAEEHKKQQALLTAWAREYRSPLIKYFQKRVPQSVDADDLVQEVFVRLARRADLETIERIDGYLFQTAANVLVDRYRKDGRSVEIAEPFSETSHGEVVLTPERVLMDRQSLDSLIRGLYEDLLDRHPDLARRTVQRRLSQWVAEGILIAEGKGPARRYRAATGSSPEALAVRMPASGGSDRYDRSSRLTT